MVQNLKNFFAFPNPVNEVTARLVAGGVAIIAIVTLATGFKWLTLMLAYGFIARVACGPRFSLLPQLAQRVVIPALKLEPKYVAGPPKRFAQSLGVVFSVSSAVLWIGFDQVLAAQIVLGMLIVAATLESVFAICLGCIGFNLLIRAGVIPEEVCERCANIWGDAPPPQPST